MTTLLPEAPFSSFSLGVSLLLLSAILPLLFRAIYWNLWRDINDIKGVSSFGHGSGRVKHVGLATCIAYVLKTGLDGVEYFHRLTYENPLAFLRLHLFFPKTEPLLI